MPTAPPLSHSAKLVELEALRGIAAVVVLVHHVMLAFYPAHHGLLLPNAPQSIWGTPFFAFINGSAAVVLFFVLSGFVLTTRAFSEQRLLPLANSAIKRWPRLMLPILAVNLASGLIAAAGLYDNVAAAREISSPWLPNFFTAPPDGWRTIAAAAKEGTITTFLRGSANFNSNLWTMRYEFLGSFIALGSAALAIHFSRYATLIITTACAALAVTSSPFYACFVVGVAIAYAYSTPAWATIASALQALPRAARALIAIGLVILLGYHEAYAPTANPAGWYSTLSALAVASPLHTRVALHATAATIMIIFVLALPSVGRALAGPTGAYLGRLSFPLYLTQIPIICSAGAAAFLATGSAAAATAISVLLSFLTALPLMRLESWWLERLRSIKLPARTISA